MSKQTISDSRAQRNLKILLALLTHGGKSDRAIAKVLGVNNSTLTKRRRKLEQEGYIKEYTFLPDFHKMGLEFVVFSISSTSEVVPPENLKFLHELSQKLPEMLCLLEDHDVAGTNWFSITVHRNYDEFVKLYEKVQEEYAHLNYVPRVESKRVVFHTNKLFPKPFSLRKLDAIFQPAKPLNHARKTRK